MDQERRWDVYAEALGYAGFLKAEHYVEPNKFGVELIRPTETNPKEINVAAEARDDYEDLGEVDDASTSIGHDDLFEEFINKYNNLIPERYGD